MRQQRLKSDEEVVQMDKATADSYIYGQTKGSKEGYYDYIPTNEDEDEVDEGEQEFERGDEEVSVAPRRPRTIAERQDEYHSRARNLVLSPERVDPFSNQTPNASARTYAEVMREKELEQEEREVRKKISEKLAEKKEMESEPTDDSSAITKEKKRRR